MAERYLATARAAATGQDARGEPLLEDLQPRFAASARLLWADALNDLAQAYRLLGRPERARLHAERVRGVLLEALPSVPRNYVGDVFRQGGTALTTLSLLSAGAAREALVAPHRAWQLRAQGHLSRLVESARLY